LMFLVLINLFFDKSDAYFSIVYGVFLGLLIDVVYTGILGAYMFVYPFSVYIVHLLKRFLQTGFSMTLVIAVISLIVAEFLLFFIYSVVNLIDITFVTFLLRRLLPRLLANILFLIPVYLLSVKHLGRWSEQFGN